VLFSCGKGESHTLKSGYKLLGRRLRGAGYAVDKLDASAGGGGVDAGGIAEALLPLIGGGGGGGGGTTAAQQPPPPVLVLGCPRRPFDDGELDALRALLRAGGSLLVCLGEAGGGVSGGGYDAQAALGFDGLGALLDEFGVAPAGDAVVRAAHDTYGHPKEARVADGVLNRALLLGSGGRVAGGKAGGGAAAAGGGAGAANGLAFVYPYGCSLGVQPPGVAVLSSGRVCHPRQRPLGACVCCACCFVCARVCLLPHAAGRVAPQTPTPTHAQTQSGVLERAAGQRQRPPARDRLGGDVWGRVAAKGGQRAPRRVGV
jgi:hypothetical protein